MSDRVVNHIRQELESLPVKKRIGTSSAMIQCPYHKDKTPSGGINLNPLKPAPLGWFRCMGCKTSVPWNTLATTMGMRPLERRSDVEVTDKDYSDPKNVRANLLPEDDEDLDGNLDQATQEEMAADLERLSFKKFPEDMTEWRGFSVKFLKKLGCRYAKYTKDDGYSYKVIYIPCMVNEERVGYVKAFLAKVDGRMSYINAPGRWSVTHGLLFFDYAWSLAKRKGWSTLVLVEGPRDAMRLLREGIPAVCILGTHSWSEDKRLILEQAGVENILLFMDGDNAGHKATKYIAKSLKGYFGFKYMNLWKYERDWDPGNCPHKFLVKVKQHLV